YTADLVAQYPSGLSIQNLLAAKLFKISPEFVIVGNGAAELINVLGRAYEGNFAIMQPTFYEYIDAIGTDRIVSGYTDAPGFAYSVNDLLSLADNAETLILINPDNPSGHYLSQNDLC